jgi:lipoprotein-anchoring transpeptidase ErfK/SrfK
MSGIRTISSGIALSVLALALAACTSTTTVVKYVGGGPSSGSATAAASAAASASAKPTPAGPAVTITPGIGVKTADPGSPITVTAAGGTLKNVTVATPGDPVSGTYSAGRTAWHSAAATLDVSQSYTVTATATAANGATTTKTSAFRTLTPASTFTTEIFEGEGATYGVGMPIILTFSHPIKNKAAVERSIELTTSKRVVGAWYWDGNSSLDFRPRDFWPAHTTVSFTGRFNGVQGAPGVYGYHTLTQTFAIGQSVIAVASTRTHRTQIYIDGKIKYNWPISTGRDNEPTPDGSYLTVDKNNPVRMIGGGKKGSPGYYNELVNWAVRFTFSGDYYHSAPWSVVDQGTTNVSHGCVNLAPPDAVIYYKLAVPGDPITVTGSPRPGRWDDGWTEWFLSWNQLLSGSALGEAVVAGPQGSTFVKPSSLSPNTAKTPLGTAMAGNDLD